MITIKDVAKHAGVSITSASYALNGTGSISEETRKRILAVAEELNYHPNAFARNLKNQKSLTIGVFISRFGGSFYEDILEGIHSVVINTDYELLVCPESRAVRKMFTQRQVDGAIVFDTKIRNATILKLASRTFPVVVMDRHLESGFILPLLVDNSTGAREVFYHLYNQGARKLAFVSGASDSADNSERTAAFLAEAQFNQCTVSCYEGNFTETSGYEAANAMIAVNDLPEAVFCANDQMAIGFMRALREHQLKAPDDVLVVGFDDIQIAGLVQPSLTTIGTSRFDWGALAAAQLIDYLEKGSSFNPARIPTRLIQRQSSIRPFQPASHT